MTLRVSILATVLVNAGTAWAFHEYGGTDGAADAPPPATAPAAEHHQPDAELGSRLAEHG
ncbi:hypothetical protein [Actinoplanes sp. NPDC049265]|uniref:hypothetical protein n=1 Tax=Actinoplanes sp. NPDC049265 TaxID=3363902 RepID=UPI00370FC7CE